MSAEKSKKNAAKTAAKAPAIGHEAPSRANELRAAFLQYFADNDHVVEPSAPLVPRHDPTLMFTNAGMVPFKNVFTGQEKPSALRAASSQKCVRAGGKHNDLDNVGYTARHHTFFEMLGNFSFGDYFKEQAISLAWDFLTGTLALPTEKLLVTVYVDDDEAAELWKKISGFGDDKILRIAGSDNFWSMGDTGPCGPCSEIFYDHGAHLPGGPPGSPDQDGDRFVEIWNLVFMQFEQQADGNRIDLPRPSIDTGMGLERIAAVMQGTHDNYEIDLFKTLIAASVDLTGVPAEGAEAPSHRIIADHLRASSFLIADGVLPSNEGRGYVLRRIMRRAMRHAHMLGAKDPLLHRLVPTLVGEMGRAFPELQRGEALIDETLKLEETRFRETLERGLRLLDDALEGLSSGDTLSGEIAFKLYDTYGFPYDLTEDALKAKGIGVDAAGFKAAMERQRAEARKSWSGSGEAATDKLWYELKEEVGATEFLGYETEAASGEIVALVKDGARVDKLEKGDHGIVIVNQTPFYAESGGQVGDQGTLSIGDETVFSVSDTQKKLHGLFLHDGVVEKGKLLRGETVSLSVDHGRRTATRAHHSATHLLHEALRQVLGTHVAQKGSLVEPGRLRFDFSHPKPMSAEELKAVEDLANAMILQNSAVETHLMTPDEAIARGALALFGEKYGEEVRVVSMGVAPESEKAGHAYSIELCGGTHVARTGDIGLLKIVGESAVAAGVRRVEALTGEAARGFLGVQDARVREAADILKVPPDEMIERLAAIVEERRKLERQLTDAKRELALRPESSEAGSGSPVRDIGGTKLLARVVHGVAPKDLRGLVDEAKQQLGSGIVAVVGVSEEGKAGLIVGVTEDLTGAHSAVDLVRVGADILGGKGGGGRPDLAQAGGPDGAKADAALEAIAAQLGAAPESEPAPSASRRAGQA
ncbi:alanyl-tRNA synthetase [Methyloceanibacter caenitepidi]|uniref:Alanine--tRNA ligase n=1 Tax=Methyloceanibacter caenitepidi TaxID=1384459 RepID=A0A0A8K2X1_9HYPH|nr:alanyl-tRNA synthetase [Methyloceanibacter caenitepidi]